MCGSTNGIKTSTIDVNAVSYIFSMANENEEQNLFLSLQLNDEWGICDYNEKGRA